MFIVLISISFRTKYLKAKINCLIMTSKHQKVNRCRFDYIDVLIVKNTETTQFLSPLQKQQLHKFLLSTRNKFCVCF